MMLFFLGLFFVALGIGLSMAPGTITRTRLVNGYAVPYQVTVQPFFEIGVFMIPIGLIVLVMAFIMTRVTTKSTTPPAQVKRSRVGFAISLIAGIMSFLLGLSYWADSLAIPSGGAFYSLPGPTAPLWFPGANLGALGAVATVSAIIVIIGAILMYAPAKETVGRILVITFSVIGFITLGISILFNVIGIIGGTLGLSKTSMKDAAARAQSFSVNLKQLTALFLLITIAGAPIFWASQRVDMHRRWASQANKTQSIVGHFYVAAKLLNSTSFETDEIAQEWFSEKMEEAGDAVAALGSMDAGHRDQLFKIVAITIYLSSGKTSVLDLNATGRSTLAESLLNIGWKLREAYSNFADSYGTDPFSGPLFSYFGPSPPDETILQQALDLANSISPTTSK